MIDEAAEPDPADGRRHKEDARHHSGRHYRLGLQEHPEGNRKHAVKLMTEKFR
jgi:hypothetical protein